MSETEFDEALPADATVEISVGQLDAALRDAHLDLTDEPPDDNALLAAYQAGANAATSAMHQRVIERGDVILP